MIDINAAERRIVQIQTHRQLLQKQITFATAEAQKEEQDLDEWALIREVLNSVTQQIQESVKQKMEKFVTRAIAAIYDTREITFHFDFEEKANKMTCRAYFMEDAQEMDPKDDAMGGLLDVASFALRLILFALQPQRKRRTIVLDEPFKNLGGGEYGEAAAAMVQRISHELGVQFIIITHDEEFVAVADAAWEVRHDAKKGSKVVRR
jgi:DNA repair exonuclease SbcCD ATPase subunit